MEYCKIVISSECLRKLDESQLPKSLPIYNGLDCDSVTHPEFIGEDFGDLHISRRCSDILYIWGDIDCNGFYEVTNWNKFIDLIKSLRVIEGVKIPDFISLSSYNNDPNLYEFLFDDRSMGFTIDRDPLKVKRLVDLLTELKELCKYTCIYE